jgi:DnaJ-class molecular chaperone
VRVRIPPGVDNGSTVRVPGKGHAGARGGPTGDLQISVTVSPHPLFERRGANLYLELPVTYAEAALGAKVEVPTFQGSARIRVPPGTQSGQVLRLSGKGLPARGGAARGDLFVTVRVTVPQVVEESSKDLLREFARRNAEDPRAGLKKKVTA